MAQSTTETLFNPFLSAADFLKRESESYPRRSNASSGVGRWLGLAALSIAVAAAVYFGPEVVRYIKAERM
jgi:hypothetical protein